jgi:hypothetical protein
MKRIVSVARSFKRQAGTIVVLLLIVAAYFAAAVPRKTQYYNDRYLRLLAGASDNLSEVVGNLGVAFWNAARSGLEGTNGNSRKELIEGALKLTPYFSRPDFDYAPRPPPMKWSFRSTPRLAAAGVDVYRRPARLDPHPGVAGTAS